MGNSLKNQDRVIKEGHKIDLRDIHIFGSDKRGVISYAWFSSRQILEWNFNNFVIQCV